MDVKTNKLRLSSARTLLWLSASTFSLLPSYSFALGLGKIQVHSALNQTLNAEIPLLAAQPNDLEELQVRISTQSFDGLTRSTQSFGYSVEQGQQNLIRLTSDKPLREPLLNLLVEVEWPSGRLLREFAVLLDPPSFVTQITPANSAPPAAQLRQTVRPGRLRQRPAQPPAAAPAPEAAPVAAAAPAPAPVVDATISDNAPTYRVKRGDTLWRIASRMRPNNNVSVQAMMQALLTTNPQAFVRNNINALKAGAQLTIPNVAGLAPNVLAETVAQPPAAQPVTPQPIQEPTAASQPVASQPAAPQPVAPQPAAPQPAAPQPAAPQPDVAQASEPAAEAEQLGQPEVRLLPPDTASVASDASSGTALQANPLQPKLKIASFEELQNRIDSLAEVDNEALTAAQPDNAVQPATAVTAPTTESTVAPRATAADATPIQQPAVTDAAQAESPQTAPADASPQPRVAAADSPATETDVTEAAVAEPAAAAQTAAAQTGAVPTDDTTATAVADPAATGAGQTASGAETTDTAAAPPAAEPAQADAGQTDPAPALTQQSVPPQSELAANEPADAQNTVADAAQPLQVLTTDNANVGGLTTVESDWVSKLANLTEDPSSVLRDPLTLATVGGPITLLLLGLLWLLARRSRDDEMATDEAALEPEISLADQIRKRQREQAAKRKAVADSKKTTAAEAAPARASSNPLERVDLLLAVGNYREAENVARLALADSPNDQILLAKMLDVHFAADNKTKFQEDAERLHTLIDDEQDPLWQHVVDMGCKLCPEHRLFIGSLGPAAAAGVAAAAAAAAAADDDSSQVQETTIQSDPDLESTVLRAHDSTGGFNVGADQGRDDADSTVQQTVQSRDNDTTLDFGDFNFQSPEIDEDADLTEVNLPAADSAADNTVDGLEFNLDGMDTVVNTTQDAPRADADPAEETLRLDNSLDFNFDDMFDDAEPTQLQPVGVNDADGDSKGLEFQFEQASAADASPLDDIELTGEQTGLLMDDMSDTLFDSEDGVETKLELASAYLDMDDGDGARSLLEEVLQEGDNGQQERAKEMLEKLS